MKLVKKQENIYINKAIVDGISTLYNKNDVSSYLENSIAKDNKIYKNEKSNDFLARIGVPTTADSSIIAYNYNIAKNNDNVKYSLSDRVKSCKMTGRN